MGGTRNFDGGLSEAWKGSYGLERVLFDFQNAFAGWPFQQEEPQGEPGEAHSGEVVQAIHQFCQRHTAFHTKPTCSELEDAWHSLAGRSTQAISSAVETVFSVDATGTLEWQPRFRVLCLLEYVKKQGGGAMIIASNVVCENEQHIEFLAKEVPQCREIARRLLGWPTEQPAAVPPARQPAAVPPEASSPAECNDSFDPNVVAAPEKPSDPAPLPAAPNEASPVQTATGEANDNFDPDSESAEQEPTAAPLQACQSKAQAPGTVCTESVEEGSRLQLPQQDVKRPYLWLSAVDFVEMESHEEFSDLGKDGFLSL